MRHAASADGERPSFVVYALGFRVARPWRWRVVSALLPSGLFWCEYDSTIYWRTLAWPGGPTSAAAAPPAVLILSSSLTVPEKLGFLPRLCCFDDILSDERSLQMTLGCLCCV